MNFNEGNRLMTKSFGYDCAIDESNSLRQKTKLNNVSSSHTQIDKGPLRGHIHLKV